MNKLKKFFQNRPAMTAREWVFYIAMISLAALILTGGVVARYMWKTEDRNVISAKEFYFTGDLLNESTGEYVLNSTSTGFSFTLGNNADKLRYSEDTIDYTVTITCLGGDNNARFTQNGSTELSGELTGGKVSTVKIDLTGIEPGKTYKVTAVGTAGYEKTISGLFTVTPKNENVYRHLYDGGEYLVLTIWTENVKGNAFITVDKDGLIPDSTDPLLSGVNNFDGTKYTTLTGANQIVDSISFASKEYSSRTYRFFRSDDTVYTVEDFQITFTNAVNNYIVVNGTP